MCLLRSGCTFEKRELICVLYAHVFIYFACVNFRLFSLPLHVRDWLRFVIVGLPGDFC